MAINPNSNDVRRGRRGRLASNDRAQREEGFCRGVEGSRTAGRQQQRLIYRRKVALCVCDGSPAENTHLTTSHKNEQSARLSAAAVCEVDSCGAGDRDSQQVQLVARRTAHCVMTFERRESLPVSRERS